MNKEKDKEKIKKKLNTENKLVKYINNYESNEDFQRNMLNKDAFKLKNIIKKLSPIKLDINPLETFGRKKDSIYLSPEIFTSFHSKFHPSIYSSDNEFNKNDFLKAYAYNTSEGNIRDYNEDTITATKVYIESKEKNNYFYFFAIYDGHGGKGCSS